VSRNRIHRLLTLTALVGAAFSFSCGGESSGFPVADGWAQTGEVLTYSADELWEYINGAAELFVEYDVQTCQTADLASGEVTVTVDLYDMASPLQAFGVYQRESAGGDVELAGAVAASISPPYQALLVKGSTYLKVNVFEGELTDATGRQLLEGLAAALPGTAGLPAELASLPQNGMVAGTHGYQPESFLGLTELTDCLYAEYSLDGEESWQGFAFLPEVASARWEELSERWEASETQGFPVLFREVPYTGFVGAIQTGDGIIGVSGAADQAELLARLEALLQ